MKKDAKTAKAVPSEQIRELVKQKCGYFSEEYPEPTLYERAIMEYLDSQPSK